MKSRERIRRAIAVAVGVLGGVAAVYGTIWLSSILFNFSFWAWPEGRRLLLLVPLDSLVGVCVGLATAAVSRRSLAPKASIAIIVLAAVLTFAIGGGGHYSGWLTALVMYAVLAGSVYLGGIVIGKRWLPLSEPRPAQAQLE